MVSGSRNGNRWSCSLPCNCKFCAWQIDPGPFYCEFKRTKKGKEKRTLTASHSLRPGTLISQPRSVSAATGQRLPVLAASQNQRIPGWTSPCSAVLYSHPRFVFKHSGQESAECREEKQHLQPPHWETTQEPQLQNERQDHEVCEAGNGGRAEHSFCAASAAADNSNAIKNSSLNHVCALMNDSNCTSEPSRAG